VAKKEERDSVIAKSNGKERRTDRGTWGYVPGYIMDDGYQPTVQTNGTIQPPRVGTTAVIPIPKVTAKRDWSDTDEK
jgi:hypothetical protein